jgi:hypothetical protein
MYPALQPLHLGGKRRTKNKRSSSKKTKSHNKTSRKVKSTETWLGFVKKYHTEQKKKDKGWQFRDSLKNAKNLWKASKKAVSRGGGCGGNVTSTEGGNILPSPSILG